MVKNQNENPHEINLINLNIFLGDYAGTADYYEPYDPDAVAQSGHSVVTTETLPVEVNCFDTFIRIRFRYFYNFSVGF